MNSDLRIVVVGGAYLIFRTSWVYGSRGKNFLNAIMKLAAERDELMIVDDQIGAPTWSREIAKSTKRVVIQLISARSLRFESLVETLGTRRGIYNMIAVGDTSWYGFARAIVEEMKTLHMTQGKLATVLPIPTSQYPLPAQRPQNSRLSGEKLRETFKITLLQWRDSLTSLVEQIAEQRGAICIEKK